MPADRLTRKALEVGRAEAREVLDLRSAALRSRNRAARAVRARTRARPAAADATRVRAAGDPATAGVLVAEGDSWFDYPLNDVLRMLEDNHAYDVESVAHKGDSVEDMAYGRGQLEELTRRLEKLLRRGVVPKAILLSGGGNDVAGDEFGMLLNHTRSAIRGLNEQVVAGVIDERVKFAYLTILSAVTAVCEDRSAGPCRSWCTATTTRCRTAGDSSAACCSSRAPGSSRGSGRRDSTISRSGSSWRRS
jgi:hypothetical protein